MAASDDSDADTAEMYGVGLELAGFRACVANSDAEALTVLRQERPAVVIADLGAGDGEGWALIQSLRADRSTRHIPVVVLTGRTDARIGRRAAELGCAALLVKPCLPNVLLGEMRRLHQLLQHSHELRGHSLALRNRAALGPGSGADPVPRPGGVPASMHAHPRARPAPPR